MRPVSLSRALPSISKQPTLNHACVTSLYAVISSAILLERLIHE